MRLTTGLYKYIRISLFLPPPPSFPFPSIPHHSSCMWMPHTGHPTYICLYYISCISSSLFFIPPLLLPSYPPPHPILPPPSDPEYGLPVQVRDQALGVKDNLPQSDVGREYYLKNMEKEVGHVMVAMVIIVLLCSIHVVSTAAVSNRETKASS